MGERGQIKSDQMPPPFESEGWHWVAVSDVLVRGMVGQWSKPVEVRIDTDGSGILEMTFREPEPVGRRQ